MEQLQFQGLKCHCVVPWSPSRSGVGWAFRSSLQVLVRGPSPFDGCLSAGLTLLLQKEKAAPDHIYWDAAGDSL
jgi:hypothetical protein